MAKLIVNGKYDGDNVKIVCVEDKDGIAVAAYKDGEKDIVLSDYIHDVIADTDIDVAGMNGVPNLSIANAYDVLTNYLLDDVESYTCDGTPREAKNSKDKVF